VFAPMGVMGREVKVAALLQEYTVESISRVRDVCLRWLGLLIQTMLEWTLLLPTQLILEQFCRVGLTRRGQTHRLSSCVQHLGLKSTNTEKFGNTEHITYYPTGNDRMRQDDVANSEQEYKSAVTGGSGKYFSPKGLTAKVGTSHISDGFPKKIPHKVYIPSAKKTMDFLFEGVREKFIWNKICGTDTCIVSARLKPHATIFHANENEDDGAGLPFDGLQPVGHIRGPSTSGRPEYLHQPLFVDGDEMLYTQKDNSHTERADGMASRFIGQRQIPILAPSILVHPSQITSLLTRLTLIRKKKYYSHILTSRLLPD